MILPQSRNADLVEQQLDREILIYDLKINKAYSLNETVAAVYRHCDGQTTIDDVIEKENLSKEIIYLSLKELAKQKLIEFDESSFGEFANQSRRDIIRKIGLAGVFALPVISAIIAPTALNAQSRILLRGNACTAPSQCQSGVCSLQGFAPDVPSSAPTVVTCVPVFEPPICIPNPPGPPICIPGFQLTQNCPSQQLCVPGYTCVVDGVIYAPNTSYVCT